MAPLSEVTALSVAEIGTSSLTQATPSKSYTLPAGSVICVPVPAVKSSSVALAVALSTIQ